MHTLSDLSIDFTLNNLELVFITGAAVGIITGQLMKSRGKNILLDLVAGLFGAMIGVFLLGMVLNLRGLGLIGALLLALIGSIVCVVLTHLGLAVQHKAKAA